VPAIPHASLELIYRAHGRWLLNWLTDRARCRVRASDLVQETFCRLAAQGQLSFHSHPRRYLATVARRLLIDDVRRQRSEQCFLEAFALHMGDTADPCPDRIVAAVQELSALAELLGTLPDRVGRAFLMSRIDGLTYAEIGQKLGVSASMVKQYVARAFAHCYLVMHDCPN
jgi:RNA polymerase sigma-70 factor (ECF subfamily)